MCCQFSDWLLCFVELQWFYFWLNALEMTNPLYRFLYLLDVRVLSVSEWLLFFMEL